MKTLCLLLLLVMCVFLSGCAAGAATSATAGYSLKASTADELSPKARKTIIEEAVEKAFTKCKEYIDKNFVKKEQ